jgi:calcineurin-like phosphoesterase family protein
MRFFIADTHFGNETLIRAMLRHYPGTHTLFPSNEAYSKYIIYSINEVVGVNDELFVLGDFAGKKPGKYRARIKCKHIYLIRGNHDSPMASKAVFGETPDMRQTKVRKGGKSIPVILSHYPMAFWDGSHKGWGHLYGHTHGQREEQLNQMFPGRRAFDCTVDNLLKLFGSYRPVSEERVFDIFDSLPGHDDVAYYRQIQDIRDKQFFGHEACT